MRMEIMAVNIILTDSTFITLLPGGQHIQGGDQDILDKKNQKTKEKEENFFKIIKHGHPD